MADLVLHIRDISHPHSDDQKKVVLQVLKDIEFDESFYTKKMARKKFNFHINCYYWNDFYFKTYDQVEVWNKVDLIERPLDLESIKNSDYPIIPIRFII